MRRNVPESSEWPECDHRQSQIRQKPGLPESPERPECRQLSSISISIATSQVLLLTLPHSHVRRHEVAMKRIGTSKIVLASLGGASPEQVRHGQANMPLHTNIRDRRCTKRKYEEKKRGKESRMSEGMEGFL